MKRYADISLGRGKGRSQADGKGLEGGEWIRVVHGEYICSNLSKL